MTIEIETRQLLQKLTTDPHLHLRWLNTLSYLENSGARKIARYEHPTLVKSEMLKHAAEEFRHAYHLKKQMEKIGVILTDYSLANILGGYKTLQFLNKLELAVCKILKYDHKLNKFSLKEAAYLLVTYAIEVRASYLYPCYQSVLTQMCAPISVRFIIAEEEQHLAEMNSQLAKLFPDNCLQARVLEIEAKLYCELLEEIKIVK